MIFLKTMHELSLFNERVPSFQRLSIDSVIERATSYPYYDQPSDEDWKSMMSDFQTNPSKPLILLAGTGHHAAAVVFVKNYIFIVDTDNLADVNKPTCITIYELGTELTSDHLKTIANISNRDDGLRESDMIKQLQLKSIGSIQKKHQKMGTCTKSASFGICLTLFVIEHILRRDEGFIFNQAQIDQALKDAYRAYKKFSSQQRLLAIEFYLDYLKKQNWIGGNDSILLVGIAEKLSVYNRDISKAKAQKIGEIISTIVTQFKREFTEKDLLLIEGCLFHFQKRFQLGELPLFKEMDRSRKNDIEAIGARRALQLVLQSNRLDFSSFLEEYLKFYSIDAQDELGHSPIFYAAAFASEEVVELLLKQTNARIDIADKKGRYPIYWACKPSPIKEEEGPLFAKAAGYLPLQKGGFQPIYEHNSSLLFQSDCHQTSAMDHLLKEERYPLIKTVFLNDRSLFKDAHISRLLRDAISHNDETIIQSILEPNGNDSSSFKISSNQNGCNHGLIGLIIQKNRLDLLTKIVGDTPSTEIVFEIYNHAMNHDQFFDSVFQKYGMSALDTTQKNKLLERAVTYHSSLYVIQEIEKAGGQLDQTLTHWNMKRHLIHSAIDRGAKEIVDYFIKSYPKLRESVDPKDQETAQTRIDRRDRGIEKKWR